MKILCETQVLNRQTQANRAARAVKSTLALGYKHCAKDANGNSKKELEIVHFSPQNKAGERYKVHNNIVKIFTKFVLDGKATISFKQPPFDLLIKCDPIQLKGFLMTLKLGMEGKDSINLRLNIAAATAIPAKAQPQQRMVITKRSDYPIKGFPRSLKTLTMNNIQLQKISFEICTLKNLTVLNLCGNNITKVPTELGRLSLNELHLAENSIGESNNWDWLKGLALRTALRELDLSANKLTYFPPPLIKCEQLVTLKLNTNALQHLPFGIRRLRNLRFLHVSTNKLASLPAVFDDMRVDNLDIWGNKFQPIIEHPNPYKLAKTQPIATLELLAARAVCQYKLPYDSATLPWLLVDFIAEAPKCACGKLCYTNTIYERAVMAKFVNIKNMVFSRDRCIYEDIVLCGPRCIGCRQMSELFLAEPMDL